MIRLTLTLTEAQRLQQLLAECGSVPDSVAQTCLDKLGDAIEEGTQQRVCPVCQESFTQLNSGRTAQYCSPACKQRAYRIRCNLAKRQFGPYRRS